MVIFQKGARKVKYPMHSNQFEKNDQILQAFMAPYTLDFHNMSK